MRRLFWRGKGKVRGDYYAELVTLKFVLINIGQHLRLLSVRT